MKHTFRWFQPGLGVKRWAFLIFTGAVLTGIGSSHAVSAHRIMAILSQLTGLDLCLMGLGLVMVVVGLVQLVKSMAHALAPEKKGDISDLLWKNRLRLRGPHMVVVGGGTGLATLLKGLKGYSTNLTAVVTVADDGGSSGRLRRDLEVLPPGDVRNCLTALARSEDLMSRLFQYRFQKGGDLVGHSFGNLLIAALSDITGDFLQAIKVSGEVLAIAGEVFPSTCQNVVLNATFTDGSRAQGETKIVAAGKAVREIRLTPANAKPPPGVVERLHEAELIVLGPGSLFTSVIPNLLVPDVASAINASPAPVAYVCNIMTQPGETADFDLGDHLTALIKHTALERVDYVVVNTGEIPPGKLQNYARRGARPVPIDDRTREDLGDRLVEADLVDAKNYIRHDSFKLALTLMKLIELRLSRRVRVLRAHRVS